MDGVGLQVKKGIGGCGPSDGWFSFKTNGTSDPSLAVNNLVGPLRGFINSITYSATGVYTIVFNTEFHVSGAAAWSAKFVPSTLAYNTMNVTQTGSYTEATRTLVLQMYDLAASTSGKAPDTVSRVNVFVDHVNLDVT